MHGAGSAPDVFDAWPPAFPGADVIAPDLHAGVAVGSASMQTYAERIVATARGRSRPLLLVGWSMGGLIAMMAAPAAEPDAMVLLEPSPPAETHGVHLDVDFASGTYDPEEEYGPFPPGIRARPESARARSERKRGISVRSLPCPTLVVSGRDYAEERGRAIASRYACSWLEFVDIGHWGLVLAPEVRSGIRAAIATGAGPDAATFGMPDRRRTIHTRRAAARDA